MSSSFSRLFLISFMLVSLLGFGTEAAHAQQRRSQSSRGGSDGGKSLDRAVKLYDSGDYASSSILLHKIIEGEVAESEANRQKAEFFMGKCLYNMKFYAPALTFFDRIVQKGAQHSYFNATLKWLATLAKVLPESGPILERIGKYDESALEQAELDSVRNELYFLLGRYYYNQGGGNPGNFQRAISLFQRVPFESEYYVRAKFFEGVTRVRANDPNSAAEAFKLILRKHIERPDASTAEYVDLANLALARTFYSTEQFPTSVKYFEKIPQETPEWLPSLFESSWAYFRIGPNGYAKALGNIHTLNAPYFENEFFPESLILKSVIYFYNCKYDQAAEALAEFEREYPPLKAEIDALLKRFPDNASFHDLAVKIRQGRAGLPDRVERAARGGLADLTMAKNLAYIDELEHELQMVERAEPAWKSTAVAAAVLQDLTLQRSLAANEVGSFARSRLQRLSEEIGELDKQRLKIEYEILNGQKGQLSEAVASELQNKVNQPAPRPIVVDDEHEYWPFNGEYWKDELGYYRVKIVSQCKR